MPSSRGSSCQGSNLHLLHLLHWQAGFLPSLGQEPRLLGFPPASWCRAALQASRESLSWFPSSCAGRAFSQGLEVSGVPGGIGVEAL